MKLVAVLRGLLIAAVVAAYAVLSHQAASRWAGSSLGVSIALTPLLALAGGLAWRALGRITFVLLLLVAGGALSLVWPWLRNEAAWLSFLPHIGMNACLAWFFGSTLLPGKTALITGFALRVHAQPSPVVLQHTRQATQAWTLFFLLDAIVSAMLFALAPQAIWSAFANLGTLPLVALMFLAEYLIRCWRIPAEQRSGLIASVRAYLHSEARPGSAPPLS